MRNDEILAAGFADHARVRTVAADVLAHLAPHAVEDGRASGEMDAGKLWRIEKNVRDLNRVAWNEVDHAGRETRTFEQAEHVVAAQHRARCRLPDHRVAHQGWCRRQVAANRGE